MWRVHVSIFSNGECWYLVQRWSVNHELSSSDIKKKITIIIIAQKPLARAPSAARKQKATSVLVFTGTSGDICRQGDPSVAKALVTYKGRGFLQAGRDRWRTRWMSQGYDWQFGIDFCSYMYISVMLDQREITFRKINYVKVLILSYGNKRFAE